jgi:hypothetical protein
MGFLPSIIFWVLILLGSSELGVKGVLVSIGIWGGLLLVFIMLDNSGYMFIAAESLLDIILVFVIFGGDIRLGE